MISDVLNLYLLCYATHVLVNEISRIKRYTNIIINNDYVNIYHKLENGKQVEVIPAGSSIIIIYYTDYSDRRARSGRKVGSAPRIHVYPRNIVQEELIFVPRKIVKNLIEKKAGIKPNDRSLTYVLEVLERITQGRVRILKAREVLKETEKYLERIDPLFKKEGVLKSLREILAIYGSLNAKYVLYKASKNIVSKFEEFPYVNLDSYLKDLAEEIVKEDVIDAERVHGILERIPADIGDVLLACCILRFGRSKRES